MGINADEVLRLLKQKQETREERILRLLREQQSRKNQSATVVSSVPETTAVQENDDRFFKAGAFSDGYQFGDITKTILGTAGDIGVNAVKGASSLVEGVTDLLGYAGAGIADLFGADKFASDWKKNIQKNTVDAIFKGAEDYVDKSSVLGDRSDAISQGLGQVAAILLTGGVAGAAGLGSAGATALTTAVTGLSGMGSGMSQAYQEGATDGEAVAYGAIAGTAEALTEWIFAGMGKSVKALGFSKGLSSADDILAKKLSSKISSQLGKNLVQLGVKAGAEGTEEVLSGIAQAFGKKLTYMSEEDLGKIVKDERLFDQFLTGAITSGIAQSGIVPGMKAGSFREANQTGRDMITGLTQNEQAVVDKEFADRVAERKKSGELSKKQEAEIYDKVLEDMESGRISTDTIESVLGGETYKGYQSLVEQEKALTERQKALQREIDALQGADNTIGNNRKLQKAESELEEVTEKLKSLDAKSAKSNLFSEVDKLTANDTKLRESYNERTRRGQAFTADLSQYDEKLRPTIQRAIDNGKINNTRATHAFVEGLAKIEAEKGIGFDFTNNQRLAELGLTVAGRNVGGYVDGANVTLNLSSSEALNKVVGHEVTHVFEGSGQYDALMTAMKEFAAEKGIDWDARVQEMTERYQNVKNADPEKELLADLVGEYLFTDSSFVESLSTKNPGLFKKIYEEIKYLVKTFAGTKQGAALEKVKNTFAELYREADVKNTAQTDGVRYALAVKRTNGEVDIVDPYKVTRKEILDYMDMSYRRKIEDKSYFPVSVHTPKAIIDTLRNYNIAVSDKPLAMQAKKARQAQSNQDIHTKDGYTIRGHAMSAEEVMETIDKMETPNTIIQETERKKTVVHNDGFKEERALSDAFVVFVTLDSGKECVAVLEFDSSIDSDYLIKDGNGDEYNTTITIFEPDVTRKGVPYDYFEYLSSKRTNRVLEIIEESSDSETANGENLATVSEKELSTDSIRNPDEKVNGKFFLSGNEQTTAPAGGYRITGEDIAAQEIAAAQPAPRNDVQEITAPTREDIMRMEAEKELHGPWRMTDQLDQKVEKLYRMMLREEVSEEDYIAQLVKADRQYQQRGSKVEEALERVREAYSKETAETPETEKKMERLTRKVLHKGIMDRIRDSLAKAGFDLNTVLKNAKNLSTFATVDNTPQRVNEKTFGYKAGQVINDLTVNKAALNESDGIQWLNGQIDKIRKMSERYGIKPGSKESRAAQIYGEGFWVNEVGEYIQYGDAELAADFPDTEKQAKIKALAKSQEVRQMYDDTLDAINEARVRNGYPAIPRRENYFLHYRAQDDTFSRIGVPFNPNDVRAKDLPTDLNGVTADLKPGKPFFASEMHRTGDKTTHDLLGGLERYMNSAKNQIYHIDDIQTLRAMRNYIADMFGQANGLADLDSLSPEEQEQRIKEVFDNHLSTYAKFLNEEANIFAGKTALIDRGVEGVLGRRAIQFLHTLNGQVGKNMVGYNISSAGTNVLPVVQATAMLPKADMVKAFAQTISNKFHSDGFVESDPALIRRRGADQFTKTPWQRISDPGYALMGAVDNLSSELIVRAKYNELTRKGMDSQQAHIRAGEWASRLMGDRSLGQMPQLYNSKTLGLITKFQLEVRNQLDAMGYDVIQEAKAKEGASNAKKAVKVASTMAQLAIFQHLFGQAYESIAGYNPTFDIVENLIKLFGFDDEEESEDTFGDNVEQAFLGLLEDLPYTSTFTGGRIPIASALPVKEVITGKDSYGNEKNRWETLAGALPYYVLPGGYGQAKKMVAGLKMFDEDLPVAGSYTESGNLRFPVEEDSIADWLQAALFGQYASKNAREYFDNGWAPLKEKQIEEFAALDIPIADYREIRKQLGKLGTTADKVDYIGSLDLTVEQKNILVNNVVDRNEPVDMTDYDMYEDFDEFDFYIKNQEKYQFLKDNGIAYKTYNASEESREAYNWAFQNPEKYQVSRAVTEDTVTYKSYTKALSEIKADKDGAGKTVSGSRKKKVVQYINGLDAEYGAKLVLYKMEYPSDDTYNGKIIEYVNGIEGFTFEQKANVLGELGFTVTSDGRVTWN